MLGGIRALGGCAIHSQFSFLITLILPIKSHSIPCTERHHSRPLEVNLEAWLRLWELYRWRIALLVMLDRRGCGGSGRLGCRQASMFMVECGRQKSDCGVDATTPKQHLDNDQCRSLYTRPEWRTQQNDQRRCASSTTPLKPPRKQRRNHNSPTIPTQTPYLMRQRAMLSHQTNQPTANHANPTPPTPYHQNRRRRWRPNYSKLSPKTQNFPSPSSRS